MLIMYTFGTVTFAALCSLYTLLTGGTVMSALLVYALSGNLCMFSLIAVALLRNSSLRQSAL